MNKLKALYQKFQKIKVYQVYFVEALKANSASVRFQYFIFLIMFCTALIFLSESMNDYKPLDELPFVRGKVVELTASGRKTSPRIILDVDGSRKSYVLYLRDDDDNKKQRLLNQHITLWYLEEYSYWPLITDVHAMHIVFDNQVVMDYTIERSDFIRFSEQSKKIFYSCLLIMAIILFRIWRKYSNNL